MAIDRTGADECLAGVVTMKMPFAVRKRGGRKLVLAPNGVAHHLREYLQVPADFLDLEAPRVQMLRIDALHGARRPRAVHVQDRRLEAVLQAALILRPGLLQPSPCRVIQAALHRQHAAGLGAVSV